MMKKKTYTCPSHFYPQLIRVGKAEHASFEASTVSLHVHEPINPRSTIEALRKLPSAAGSGAGTAAFQLSLFDLEPAESLYEAVEFCRPIQIDPGMYPRQRVYHF